MRTAVTLMLALMVVLVFGYVPLRPSPPCASIHDRCGSHADSVLAGAGAGGRGGGVWVAAGAIVKAHAASKGLP